MERLSSDEYEVHDEALEKERPESCREYMARRELTALCCEFVNKAASAPRLPLETEEIPLSSECSEAFDRPESCR